MIARAAGLLLALAVVSCADDCASGLACPEPVEVACVGPLTPVALNSSAPSSCGVTNDAPAAGLPVGVTNVTLRAAAGASCVARVTVTDHVAPELSCPASMVVVRTDPSAPLAVPLPAAHDLCTAAVAVTAEPATITDHGSVAVHFRATDTAGNHTDCDAALDVRNLFPATNLHLAHAAITDTATTVTLVWEHPAASDVTAYRVERATSADGPWSAVATVAPEVARYVEAAMPDATEFYRVVGVMDEHESPAAGPVRALAVTATSYNLGVQPVPGLHLAGNPAAGTAATGSTPLHAVVRYPTELGAGSFPLVLLLHGNHGNCRPTHYDYSGTAPELDDTCVVTNTGACSRGQPTPNAEGLAYLAETLAAHGRIVASVDANAINCRDGMNDGYIAQRAQLLVEHLRRWRAWNAPAGEAPFGATFAGHVDLAHVGVFGHSRGAEAAAATPEAVAAADDVDGVTVASVFSLAPTNFDDPQPGAVPFATLVPICDGDVFTYDGVALYDRTLRHAGDEAPAAQFFLAHADHDHFNTEWRFDDNASGVLSCDDGEVHAPEVQQRTLEAIVAAWFDGTLGEAPALEPWMRAAGDVPPYVVSYAGEAVDVRRSYSSPRTLRLDDFSAAGGARDLLGGGYESTGSFVGGATRDCTGVSHPACDETYSVTFDGEATPFGWPHDNPFITSPRRSARALDWTAPDATFALDLGPNAGDTVDASGYGVLSLRVASRLNDLNPDDRAAQDFVVRVRDADGNAGEASVSEVMTVPHLYPSGYPRAVLQTVRFSLAGLAARATPAVDLRRLRRVEIGLSSPNAPTGSVLVSDVELAD